MARSLAAEKGIGLGGLGEVEGQLIGEEGIRENMTVGRPIVKVSIYT